MAPISRLTDTNGTEHRETERWKLWLDVAREEAGPIAMRLLGGGTWLNDNRTDPLEHMVLTQYLFNEWHESCFRQ